MDISKIHENMAVKAKNPGMSDGPCVINIGTVERVEDNGYIKLTRNDSPDRRDHWFPLDWVESVDEEIICLNQSAEKAMAEMLDELPTNM